MHMFGFKRLDRRPRVARRPDWKTRLEALKQRLSLLPVDDPLVPLLLDLLDEFALTEMEAGVVPQISDEEAHRFRGRLGMAMELRRELNELWTQSRTSQ